MEFGHRVRSPRRDRVSAPTTCADGREACPAQAGEGWARVPGVRFQLLHPKGTRPFQTYQRTPPPLKTRKALGGSAFFSTGHTLRPAWTHGNSTTKELIDKGDHQAIIDYPKRGRAAQLSVPTNEHYLPLLYTLALKDSKDPITYFNDAAPIPSGTGNRDVVSPRGRRGPCYELRRQIPAP